MVLLEFAVAAIVVGDVTVALAAGVETVTFTPAEASSGRLTTNNMIAAFNLIHYSL
jgi:hypothetical protein